MLKNFFRNRNIKNAIERCKTDCELGLIEADTAINAIIKGISLLPEQARARETQSLIDFSKLFYEARHKKASDPYAGTPSHTTLTDTLFNAIVKLPASAHKPLITKLIQTIDQSSGDISSPRIYHGRHIETVLVKSYKLLPPSEHQELTDKLSALYMTQGETNPQALDRLSGYFEAPQEYREHLRNTFRTVNLEAYQAGRLSAYTAAKNLLQLKTGLADDNALSSFISHFSLIAFEDKKMSFHQANEIIGNAGNSRLKASFWIEHGKNHISPGQAIAFANTVISRMPEDGHSAQLQKDAIELGISQYKTDHTDNRALFKNAVLKIRDLPPEEQPRLASIAIEVGHRALEKTVASQRYSSALLGEVLGTVSTAIGYLPEAERARKAAYTGTHIAVSEPMNDKNLLAMTFRGATHSSKPLLLIAGYSGPVESNFLFEVSRKHGIEPHKLERFWKQSAVPPIV